MAPTGTSAEDPILASFGSLTALPTGTTTAPTAQSSLLTAAATAADSILGTAAEATATASASTAAQDVMLTVSQADASLANATATNADGIPLTGMTTTPAGDSPTVTAPRTAPTRPTATATATDVLAPDLLAAMQATAAARTASAQATAGDTPTSGTTAAGQPTGTAQISDMASLAAAGYPDAGGGAQIVASTGPTVTRAAGPGASPTDPVALVDEVQVPTTGSMAQAAGAVAAAAVQLPGQAVAAAGASSQGTGGTLAEALEAGPDGISASQSGPNGAEAPTESHAALGAASAHGVGQAQDVDTAQAGAAAAPPIAGQIADGAMMAARRIGQSVEMILQPEGLGSVSLRVTVERGGLGVQIAMENPQARQMVQASWPQIQRALEQRGLTMQSLMLDLSNGRGGGQSFQQFAGQQFNGQQFNGQQARGGGSSSSDRRGGLAVGSVNEGTRVQASAGAAASRVDYRI